MFDIVYNALIKYYDTLAKFGYVNYQDVYKLVAYVLLYEFLNDGTFENLDETSYRTIERFMNCIQDSTCIIPNSSNCRN